MLRVHKMAQNDQHSRQYCYMYPSSEFPSEQYFRLKGHKLDYVYREEHHAKRSLQRSENVKDSYGRQLLGLQA